MGACARAWKGARQSDGLGCLLLETLPAVAFSGDPLLSVSDAFELGNEN
jgi:hypothetical protein